MKQSRVKDLDMSEIVELKPYCKGVFIEFASRRGLVDPTLEILDNIDKKHGLTAPINKVTVCGKKHGQDESLNLFIKKAPQDERLRRYTHVAEMFDRESYVYDVVLPKFQELYKDYTREHDSALRFIEYFGSCKREGEEYIVLEDYTPQGYATRDGLGPRVEQNIESAFKWIAHFHGLTFVMKKRKPKTFTELTKRLDDFQTKDLDSLQWQMFEKAALSNKECLDEMLLNEGYTTEDLEKYHTPYFNKFRKCFQYFYSPKEYGVICHGDYHKQNILFHKDNAPGYIRVVDYQYVKYASPCLDLVLLMFTSTYQYAVRPMLDLYRQCLAEFLVAFGYDVEELYPSDVFEKEWRTYVPFTILLGACSLAQISCGEYAQLNRVEVMMGNIPPDVWDKRSLQPDLRSLYLNVIEYIKRKEIVPSEFI